MKTQFVVLVIVAIVAGAMFLWPTDEKKITQNLHLLATYCSSADGESILDTMQKITSATKLFKYPLLIEMDSNNIDLSLHRKETSDRILMMKRRLPNTVFIFGDTVVNINNGQSADVTSTLRLETKTADNAFTDAYEISGSAEKINGEWLFTSFAVEEFIRK